jgi:2-polyprenyl-3-methyl-5-hydroxy-6-metoxy-1,4-benzoquinol methylase
MLRIIEMFDAHSFLQEIFLKQRKEMMMAESLYTSGQYLEKNPTWHTEESPWKVGHLVPMLRRHHLVPQTICEVGCGAALARAQERMSDTCTLWGYDISPQVIKMCQGKANARLHFKLANIRQEPEVFFDLLLVLDVIEHLEDYFSFLETSSPRVATSSFL